MLVKTNDNTNTLYSTKYKQHFHDVKTGAIKEAMQKHIIPCFSYHKDKKNLKILDICFGLGYNTFASVKYVYENNLAIALEIFSPELDEKLIQGLKKFYYPKEFESIKHIIYTLLDKHIYEDKNLRITLYIGDARKYVKTLENIDIVYQDAFSSEVNPELWTVEYFKDIYKATNENPIISTYSVSSKIRLSLYEAGFYIYEIKPKIGKKQTIATKTKQQIQNTKYIDMQLKQQRNKSLKALYDET